MNESADNQSADNQSVKNQSANNLTALGWRHAFASQLTLEELEQCSPARVLAVNRGRLRIATADGDRSIELHGAWLARAADECPTVGDWVVLDAAGMRIERVLERASLFARRAPGSAVERQLIAANVDIAFLVTSCNEDFNIARLERYLALVLDAGVTPVVVLTRADLSGDVDAFTRRARGLHRGLVVEAVNALDPASVAPLGAWCDPGSTIALLGSSGVGKSTLTNTLAGDALQATGSIRDDDAKGRHTTTARRLLRLPSGALILDGPGMRELQISDVADGIADAFADIEALARDCRFVDCTHATEPGCRVRDAIAAGDLDPARLARRAKLQREEAHNTMSIAERHAVTRAFGRKVRSSMANKRKRRGD